jgi:hypothetical protein
VVFQSTKVGIDFLGYYVKPSHTLVRKKIAIKFKNKICYLETKANKKTLATVNSYYGHFIHANSYNLRKNIFGKYFNSYKDIFTASKNYSQLKICK